MADNTTVHIGENSQEQVAYKLMIDVINREGGYGKADRKTILDTYAECLLATRGYRTLSKEQG